MENPSGESGRWKSGGFEDNILATLDASEAKDSQDTRDDRIAFLHAVRAASIVPEHGTAPTFKILEAVFHILRVEKSLELIMASYQLLIELDKHFPRVYFPSADKFNSSSNIPSELVVAKEEWSPFALSFDSSVTASKAADEESAGPLDSSSFHLVIQELAEMSTETKSLVSDVKSMRNMLLFQYLVNVFEGDFLPRNATMNWNIQRESLLNKLLGSRKINYKGLIKDCLTVICQLSQLHNEPSNDLELQENSKSGFQFALLEVGKNTCASMEKLLVMIMELDMSRKKADIEGYTTRADGVRTPLLEIILDELTYSDDTVPQFLQIFSEPKWKLEIVVQYFWKYVTKPSVRTHRSNGSSEDATFNGALKCFANSTSTKSIIKKIGAETVQLLLAHGFQAQLSVLSEGHVEGGITGREERQGGDLVNLCNNVISAFNCLTNEHTEILPIVKEALFTAATIISIKS